MTAARAAALSQTSPLLTTADVSRLLERTPRGTRWIVDAHGIAYERTTNGQRLFQPSEVKRLLDRRAASRLAGVRTLRPKRLSEPGEPRQLSFFGTRLAVIASGGGSTSREIGGES